MTFTLKPSRASRELARARHQQNWFSHQSICACHPERSEGSQLANLETNLETVIPTGASRRLLFAFVPANASACAVEEPLFDLNDDRPKQKIHRAQASHAILASTTHAA
jgi:hypothetical protein